MVGTLINMTTVAIGSTLGLLVGDRLPKATQDNVIIGLGIITLVVGFDNALQTGNIIIPLLCLIVGVFIGDWIDIQGQLDRFATWLQEKVAKSQADSPDPEARERFINGFVTTSLLFCVGPLTIIGSLQDGISGDYELLAIKAVLDGFASLAFAASFGVGVMFSIVTILIVQGGLTLIGMLAGNFMTDPMIAEMTATGGLMMIGLGLLVLDLKKITVANYLPGLFLAPLVVAVAAELGIDIYPNL